MDINDLERRLGIFGDAAVFDKESKEALRHARDIVAALRAARDLPKDFNAKKLVDEIWAVQVDERKAYADRYHWLRGRLSPKDIAIFAQRPAGYDDESPEYVDSAIDKEMEGLELFPCQLLSRLKQDCDYYLGHGCRHKKHLWAGDEAAQIHKMKELHAQLHEKPEWLTMEDISRYEKEMTEKRVELTDMEGNLLLNFCLQEDEFGYVIPVPSSSTYFAEQEEIISDIREGKLSEGVISDIDELPIMRWKLDCGQAQ